MGMVYTLVSIHNRQYIDQIYCNEIGENQHILICSRYKYIKYIELKSSESTQM